MSKKIDNVHEELKELLREDFPSYFVLAVNVSVDKDDGSMPAGILVSQEGDMKNICAGLVAAMEKDPDLGKAIVATVMTFIERSKDE